MNNEFKMEEGNEIELDKRVVSSIEQKGNTINFESPIREKLVERNHKFKFNNPLRQISKLPILNEDVNLENVERILMKKPKERTAKELKIVTKFIENTELSHKFKKDKMSTHSLERLLNFCAMYMEFQKLEPNTILFRQGDHGDKFYIILRGSVNILRIITRNVHFLPMDYLNYIEKLYKSGYKDLINKNIKENNDIYYLDIKEIEFLNDITFAITIKHLEPETEINEILKILTEFNKNPVEFEIDLTKKDYSNQKEMENLIDSIKRKIIGKLNFMGINLRKYNYIHNVKEKKKMTIFDEEIFLVFNEGKCFGDFALDTQSNVRTATIQGGENTSYLGLITNKIYCEYLLHEKQKLRKKEMAFILDFNIFDSISFTHFDRKYFSDFTFHECLRGEIIFKENDEMEYVYLVKEGEFEIYFHKNTSSFIDIIEKFEKVYFESFKHLVNNEIHKIIKKKITKERAKNIKVNFP